MLFSYNKLRGRIKEVCGTQENFARLLGIGQATLSQKLNNSYEFTQGEIFKSMDILKLPYSSIDEYFFCSDSSENRIEEEAQHGDNQGSLR